MLDSCWTRVGLMLDSRWTVSDLFFVQFFVQLYNIMMDSRWTHVGLGGSWRLFFLQKLCDGRKQPV